MLGKGWSHLRRLPCPGTVERGTSRQTVPTGGGETPEADKKAAEAEERAHARCAGEYERATRFVAGQSQRKPAMGRANAKSVPCSPGRRNLTHA